MVFAHIPSDVAELERCPEMGGAGERGVVYMATLPLEANVQFMTVMATKMPYIGRG